jgi:hypothetical protein
MATFDENLTSLMASVVANCDEIGSYIQNTEFIVKKYEGGSALHGYNSSRPFEYLKEWCWTRSWDEYFSHVMDMWDDDKMSAMRLNAIIERLSVPAARLDLLVPKLERECRRFPNMPEKVVRNAREMHTCVNSFLNSADDGLNLWKREESKLFQLEAFAKTCSSMKDLLTKQTFWSRMISGSGGLLLSKILPSMTQSRTSRLRPPNSSQSMVYGAQLP